MRADEPPQHTVRPDAGSEGACPACGGPLFAWVKSHAFDARRDEEYVLDRCERCGAGIARSSPLHPASGPKPQAAAEAEVEDLLGQPGADGSRELRTPNRRSLQAAIGEGNWAALELPERPLQATPAALSAVLGRAGMTIEQVRYPVFGVNQRWMWQTLVNAFTFNPNFAREALAGRLRPTGGKRTAKFVVDLMVTILATPLVVLISVPLEAAAALARRGGEIRATVRPLPQGQPSSDSTEASSAGESS